MCPLESIVLYYMMQISQNGLQTNITINDLYNIIDIYSKTFSNEIEGHDNCICKKKFVSTINIDKKHVNYLNYLMNH